MNITLACLWPSGQTRHPTRRGRKGGLRGQCVSHRHEFGIGTGSPCARATARAVLTWAVWYSGCAPGLLGRAPVLLSDPCCLWPPCGQGPAQPPEHSFACCACDAAILQAGRAVLEGCPGTCDLLARTARGPLLVRWGAPWRGARISGPSLVGVAVPCLVGRSCGALAVGAKNPPTRAPGAHSRGNFST